MILHNKTCIFYIINFFLNHLINQQTLGSLTTTDVGKDCVFWFELFEINETETSAKNRLTHAYQVALYSVVFTLLEPDLPYKTSEIGSTE